jgi:DNA-binding transcriptional MerR regulator
MIQIKEMSTRSGVPVKTIRYYEQVGLLPPARRAENRYRLYDEADVNRLRFIKNARALGFHLIEIAQILSVQDRNEPPCSHVMNTLQHHMDEIENRIQELESLRGELEALYEAGKMLPQDVQMRNCVCHLIQLGDTQGDDDGKGN